MYKQFVINTREYCVVILWIIILVISHTQFVDDQLVARMPSAALLIEQHPRTCPSLEISMPRPIKLSGPAKF